MEKKHLQSTLPSDTCVNPKIKLKVPVIITDKDGVIVKGSYVLPRVNKSLS